MIDAYKKWAGLIRPIHFQLPKSLKINRLLR